MLAAVRTGMITATQATRTDKINYRYKHWGPKRNIGFKYNLLPPESDIDIHYQYRMKMMGPFGPDLHD